MKYLRPIASSVEFVTNAYDAATGADALLILTEWEEFASLDLRQIARRLRYPIVIDGRNLYDPETMAAHGLSYYSVGRAPALPEGSPTQSGERSPGDHKKYGEGVLAEEFHYSRRQDALGLLTLGGALFVN